MVKSFAENKPVLFSILILLISGLLTELPFDGLLLPNFDSRSALHISLSVEQGGVAFLLVLLMRYLGLSASLGSLKPGCWKSLWMFIPLLLLTLLNASDFLSGAMQLDTSSPSVLFWYFLVNLSTGFIEEFLCRGVVLLVMLKKWGVDRRGVYLSVLFSSLLFSLAHWINFIMGRYLLTAVLAQMGFALFFGVYFSAMFLRMKSIYPVIIMHTLFDLAGSLRDVAVGAPLIREIRQVSAADALISILITLPLFLLGMFAMRKIDQYSPEAVIDQSIGKPS